MSMRLEGISEYDFSPQMTSHTPKSNGDSFLSAVNWTTSEPDMVFSASVGTEGELSVLKLRGELDMATVGIFEEVLNQVEETSSTIVLDLGSLAFVDCSGLHSFISAQKRIVSRGGRLMLTRPPRQIRRLFSLAHLDSFFEFTPDISA